MAKNTSQVVDQIENALHQLNLGRTASKYCAGVLRRLKWVVSRETPVAATDGTQLMINPEGFLRYDINRQSFILVHEAAHVMCGHCTRGSRHERMLGEFDKNAWAYAIDAVVNELASRWSFAHWCPKDAVTFAWLKSQGYLPSNIMQGYQPRIPSAEEVYAYLKRNEEKNGDSLPPHREIGQGESVPAGDDPDSGSGAGEGSESGVDSPPESGDESGAGDSAGDSAESGAESGADGLQEGDTLDIGNTADGQGKQAGELACPKAVEHQLADERRYANNGPEMSLAVLRNYLGRRLQTRRGYRRLSSRSLAVGLVSPSFNNDHDPALVAIGFDNSSSQNPDALKAVTECLKQLRRDFNDLEVEVFAWNGGVCRIDDRSTCAPDDPYTRKSAKGVVTGFRETLSILKGNRARIGGGTQIAPCLQFADAACNSELLVVITDGEFGGEFTRCGGAGARNLRKHHPRLNVVFLVVGDNGANLDKAMVLRAAGHDVIILED